MKVLNYLKNIFSLSAFKIGVLLTLTLTFISLNFYSIHPDEIEYDLFYGTLDLIHKKTVDLKMRNRGPREISPEVVLVTVDEESLEKIGRWVWPRNVFADLLNQMSEDGVSVIALDVIFAEPEKLVGAEALADIAQKSKEPHIKSLISQKIKQLNNDERLRESIEKNKDKIILGSYFTDEEYRSRAYQDLCYNQLYERTNEYKIMNAYEFPIGVLDSTLTEDKIIFNELPEVIRTFLIKLFDKIQDDIQKTSPKLSSSELKKIVYQKQKDFCSQFLKTEENKEIFRKNWAIFQKQDANLQQLSADDWFFGVMEFNLKNPIHGSSAYQANIPMLSEAASSTAFFRAFLDQDGVIRKAKLVARFGNKIIPSMALAAYLQAKQYNIMIEIQENPESIASSLRSGSKIINNFSFFSNETGDVVQKFPIDQYSKIDINYAGKKNTFPYVSASEILNNSDKIKVYQMVKENERIVEKTITVDRKEYLKNKIILVGATATAIYDLRVSPLDSDFPGLEIHANILDNLLQNNMYRPLTLSVVSLSSIPMYIKSLFSKSLSDEDLLKIQKTDYSESYYMPLFILIFGLIFSYIIAEVGALWGFLTLLSLSISLILADYYLLFLNNYVLTIIFPIFTMFSIYILLTFYKYLTEERKKQELKGTFQKYVSPSIVNEILSHPEKVELGGRKERMTVMFSDVRGFTTFAEKLDPKILGDFLNSYLTPMTRLVFKNNGTLDKYMGDAIMAFFGAPIHFKDHAKKCCITALEMIDKLHEMNRDFEKQNLPSIDIGIGLNTGDMSVGNMGSDIVRSYTVMGDSVNLASRLEGINKSYGTRIIISEFTYADVKNDFICRDLDLVRVKGKALPVKIYELVGQSQIKSDISDCIHLFKEGYELYLAKQFPQALDKFNAAINKVPNDGPSQLYIERCQEYLKTPPPENWDGVYEFKTK